MHPRTETLNRMSKELRWRTVVVLGALRLGLNFLRLRLAFFGSVYSERSFRSRNHNFYYFEVIVNDFYNFEVMIIDFSFKSISKLRPLPRSPNDHRNRLLMHWNLISFVFVAFVKIAQKKTLRGVHKGTWNRRRKW